MGSAFRPRHATYLLQLAGAILMMTAIFGITLALHVLQCVFSIIHYTWVSVLVCSVLYVPLLALTVVSYFRTVFADVWLPNDINSLHIERKCQKCHNCKPERTHHCRVCRACVLKMDHHCPWVGSCVGWANHKFFILFLGWAFATCLYVVVESLVFMIADFVQMGGFTFSAVFHGGQVILGGLMGLCAVAMLVVHIPLTLQNQTTIDSNTSGCWSTRASRRDNPYDLGTANNFRAMFGTNPFLAFLPVFTSQGDGINWPTNLEYERLDESSEHEGGESDVV